MTKKKKMLRINFFPYFLIISPFQKFELNTTLKVNKTIILEVINMRNRF